MPGDQRKSKASGTDSGATAGGGRVRVNFQQYPVIAPDWQALIPEKFMRNSDSGEFASYTALSHKAPILRKSNGEPASKAAQIGARYTTRTSSARPGQPCPPKAAQIGARYTTLLRPARPWTHADQV
jgi:hypothetical protein